MGYHAANVAGILTPEGRDKLGANFLKVALVDETHPWQDGNIFVTSNSGGVLAGRPHNLHIVLSPQAATRLDGHTLYLAAVNAGQVGIAQVGSRDGNGALAVHAQEIFTMTPNILPDPTIAATVDYILDEARYHQKRRDP
jgi:hypothetical protein